MGAGVRVHVGQQRLVGRGARGRRGGVGLGGEIRPHAPAVVGEGGGHPLHPVHRRALAGQRRQHRRPGTDPAVLLVGPQQCEAAAAQRECRRERARGAVVHHAHVVPPGTQQAQAAQRGQARPAARAGTARRPAHGHREPLVARAPRHGHRRQRAVEDEDADGGGDARCVGLPPQDQHAEQQPHRHRDDLARPPPGQRAAPLAWTEPVARPAPAAHPSEPSCPGGQAGGSHLITGPWPSSPM